MSLKEVINRDGYVLIKRHFSKRAVSDTCSELNSLPRRRTPLSTKQTKYYWDEISIPNWSSVATKLLPTTLIEEIESCYGTVERILFWANHYRIGERIMPHTDGEGDLQIVLCIQLPPKGSGGSLRIRRGDWVDLEMKPGDAMIFHANKTVHETTEILISKEYQESGFCADSFARIVVVGRIYLSTEVQSQSEDESPSK